MVINNPILRQAYDYDWYFPYEPSAEVLALPEYQRAVEEGWHEWIESDLDVEAIKRGYRFDISRDRNGKPCCFFEGKWLLHDGTEIDVEDEHYWITHCGAGDHYLRFSETFLSLTKGENAGAPLRFIPWQRKLKATVFGWVKDGGYRRYRHVIVFVPKKQGKSYAMGATATYMLVADGTPRAQVYGAACDRNQARIIYDDAASMVKASDALSDIIDVIDSRSRLVHQESGSFYVVLSADAHRNEGIDASCVLVDEIHVHPNRKLYSVLKRSGQARKNPMMWVISTVGPTLDESIWAELYKEGIAQLNGERPDSIHHYTMIASAQPIKVELKQDAKIGDTKLFVNRLQQPVDCETIEFERMESKVKVKVIEPAKRFQPYLIVEPLTEAIPKFTTAMANKEWNTDHAIIRSNPSVGFTFQIDRLREELKDARSPAALAEMQQLNLNIVSGVGKGIVSQAAWLACGELEYSIQEMVGKHCYGGLDISFTNDLTSFSLVFPNWDPWVKFGNVESPMLKVMNWTWVPTEGISHREELEQVAYRAYSKIPYLFEDKGCVRLCEGGVIDYAMVARDIIEIAAKFKLKMIALDPNYSQFVAPLLEQGGLTVVAHRQNAMHMSPPIKRFAEIVHRTQLAHGKHPLLTQSVANAVLTNPDNAGNQMLAKTKSSGRIDPLIATVMAVGFSTNPPVPDDGAWIDASTGMWG